MCKQSLTQYNVSNLHTLREYGGCNNCGFGPNDNSTVPYSVHAWHSGPTKMTCWRIKDYGAILMCTTQVWEEKPTNLNIIV